MRIAIYSRVSSETQTLESQTNDLKTWLKAVYSGCEIKDEYIFEEKISGAKDETERKEFAKVLQLTKNEVDFIAVWEISRLYRKTSAALKVIEDFHEKGIGIITKKENVCTLDENGKVSATGNLILSIYSSIAQSERESIIERSRRGTTYKLTNDEISHTSRPPFGYKKENKQLVIDEEKAAIVRQIFELSEQGYSYKQLAAKTGIDKSTIHHIVHNTAYIGFAENSLIEGKKFATPRIISDELYYSVQKELENRRNREYKPTATNRPLWKKVVCPICGSHLTYTSNGKYSCHKCRKVTINADLLMQVANVALNSIYSETNISDTIKRLRGNIDDITTALLILNKQLQSLYNDKEEQVKLVELLAAHSNSINVKPHIQKLENINRNIASLEAQVMSNELEKKKNEEMLSEYYTPTTKAYSNDAWNDENAVRKHVTKIEVKKNENHKNWVICNVHVFGRIIGVAVNCRTRKMNCEDVELFFNGDNVVFFIEGATEDGNALMEVHNWKEYVTLDFAHFFFT